MPVIFIINLLFYFLSSYFIVLQQVMSRVEDEGKPIQALDVSRDGKQLAIGGTGNCIQIVKLT